MRDRDEKVTLELHQHAETDAAYLTSDDGDEDEAAWLPKSLVTRGEKTGVGCYSFEVPEWLAIREGLV